MRALAAAACASLLLAGDARLAAAADPAPPAPAAAATPAAPADASKQVVRVFEIRYRDVTDVSVLIEPHLSPDALLAVNKRTRTVKVIDRPDVVQKITQFIEQFDVPPHAVVVRLVLEKAERTAPAGGADAFQDAGAWTFSPLAETVLEVLERGHATQSFGADGAFEIHVGLESVDPDRHLMTFDRFALTRIEPAATGPAVRRPLLDTALQLQDGVGKVVMTARDASADVALVVRVKGLVREPQAAGGR